MKSAKKFTIYLSDAKQPPYERGSEWERFYRQGALGKQFLDQDDIEAYDWDNQALILTEQASNRVDPTLGKFIVSLGSERMYGGKILPRMSAMAVRQPVIYTEKIEDRTVILIRPTHDYGAIPDLGNEEWKEITDSRIESHFQELGKLRHPRTSEIFTKLIAKVHRISNLNCNAGPTALEVEYSLDGSRHGQYSICEELSWTAGRESISLGPRLENCVKLEGKNTRRNTRFEYRDIARIYKSHGEIKPQLKDNTSKPMWCVTVRLSPVFDKDEMSSLSIADRISLSLMKRDSGLLYELSDGFKQVQPSTLSDVKRINIPYDPKK